MYVSPVTVHVLTQKATKSNLMDLEIADFEKTVHRLQEEINVKNEEITSTKEELDHIQQKYSSLEIQMSTSEIHVVFHQLSCHASDAADDERTSAEERCEKLKQMLIKVKKDLDEARQQVSPPDSYFCHG